MLATILVTTTLLAPAITSQPFEERAFARYRSAVDAYVLLHREAAASLPEGALCGGPEELELVRIELSRGILNARPDAREGDIFDRDVAELLRLRLRRAWADEEGESGTFAPEPDDPEHRSDHLEVNGFFRSEEGPPRWRGLFWALPALPDVLEYRLVGRDLVLLDVEARLVVDILRDALR
jgi:hypothetical protein